MHEHSVRRKIRVEGENIEPMNLQSKMNMVHHKVNLRDTNGCHTDTAVLETKIVTYILWSNTQNDRGTFEGGLPTADAFKVSNEDNTVFFR